MIFIVFLFSFLCVIAYFIFDMLKQDELCKKNPNLKKPQYYEPLTDEQRKKYSYIEIFLIISAFISLILFCGMNTNDNNSSNWNSLTKEEKQWYDDNYGNGKSQQYTDAIEKYKNTHK